MRIPDSRPLENTSECPDSDTSLKNTLSYNKNMLKSTTPDEIRNRSYVVQLSFRHILTILAGCVLSSYAVGLGLQVQSAGSDNTFKMSWTVEPTETNILPELDQSGNLSTPPPLNLEMYRAYAYRGYAMSGINSGKSVFPERNETNLCKEVSGICSVNENDLSNDYDTSETSEKEINETESHETEDVDDASGQHFLADIEFVNEAFLNSMQDLAAAMVKVAEESSLTLLSYHCHGLEPTGVSCVGILMKGHISFHTWPKEGVITFDLFSADFYSVRQLISLVSELFGIPQDPNINSVESGAQLNRHDDPHMAWSYKNRGIHKFSVVHDAYGEDDIGRVIGSFEWEKDLVATLKTEYQQIDIYDMIDITFRTREQYKRSLLDSDSYEYINSNLFQKDRVIYLDGIMQSRTFGEAAYHEALVHPAMFAHKNPKRVAIIGGGEGATLREVLKHNTVEKVVMIEIDEIMVNVSREYLPAWSSCSDLFGSTLSCFDDPRAEVHYQDAVQWFINNFGMDAESKLHDQFDVIIMDALDPNTDIEFSDFLYNNDAFMVALSNSLGGQGLLVAQIGETEYSSSLTQPYKRSMSGTFINGLIEVGILSVNIYTESHGRFTAPWQFVIAMKEDRATKSNWMFSEAEIELAIHKRTLPSKTRESSFRFFDGATMKSYQVPPRGTEDLWCKYHSGMCRTGRGFDPEITTNGSHSAFEVGICSTANGCSATFANIFILQIAVIDLHECVNGMFVHPTTYSLLPQTDEQFEDTEYFDCFFSGYFSGYGWINNDYGASCAGTDPGIFTVVNQGWNGTCSIGTHFNIQESTMIIGTCSERFYETAAPAEVYIPFNDRQFFSMGLWGTCNTIRNSRWG